jgi:predicted nucleic acid-binding protein
VTAVVDASAAAAWLMPDEAAPPGLVQALEAAGQLAAPWHFWIELRNILLVGERRGRLPRGTADAFLEAVDDLGIALDTAAASGRVLELARRHALTAYDALYLELALRRRLPLATLDTALAAAARAEGVAGVG